MRSTRLIHGLAFATAALSLIFPGHMAPMASAACVGAVILWRRRPIEVGALLILLIPSLFTSSRGVVMRGWIGQPMQAAGVDLLGSGLSVPAVLALVALAVVAGQATRVGVHRHIPKTWMILWVLGTLVGAWSSYSGFRLGHQGWSAPLRMSGVFAGFLWACTLRGWPNDIGLRIWHILRLVPPLAAGALIFGLGTGNGVFLMTALVISAGAAYWFAKRRTSAALCWLVGTMSAFAYTFTVLGIAVVVAVLILGSKTAKSPARIAGILTGVMLVMGVFLIGIAVSGGSWRASQPLEGEFAQRLESKLFDDRGELWSAAVQAIASRPAIAPPATQEFYVHGFPSDDGTYQLWNSGTHNVLLELALQLGYIGALPFAFLVVSALIAGARSAAGVKAAPACVVAISAVAVGVVGFATGHFIVRETAGLLLMLLLGLAVAIQRSLGECSARFSGRRVGDFQKPGGAS